MGYKQLRALDKNQKGERLYCLKYVRLAFSPSNDDLIKDKYASAKKCWDASKRKHTDRNFPKGVAFPIFWNFEATIDGVKENYGHIAIYLDGRVYSNPGKNSTTNPHIFDSVEAIEKYFGLGSYLGWTEDVNDVPVIEYVKDTTPTLTLGRYEFLTNTNVRTAPDTTKSNIREQYKKGEVLNNPKKIVEAQGYLWLNYTSNSGVDSYVAVYDVAKKEYYAKLVDATKKLTLPASLGSAVPVYGYADGKLVGTLNPKKFGGLEYDIVTITGNGDRVIVTETFGKVRVNPKYGTVK